jgi:hypothetical protein
LRRIANLEAASRKPRPSRQLAQPQSASLALTLRPI